MGTSEDGEESSSVQDEDEEAILIADLLSTIKAPQVYLRNVLLYFTRFPSKISLKSWWYFNQIHILNTDSPPGRSWVSSL